MLLLNENIIGTVSNLTEDSHVQFVVQLMLVVMCVLFLFTNAEAHSKKKAKVKRHHKVHTKVINHKKISLGQINFKEFDTIKPENFNFSLEQNSPNPFRDSTLIKYHVASKCNVTLEIYNDKIERVAELVNNVEENGDYAIPFKTETTNGRLPNGIYFYRLRAGEFVEVKKMIIMNEGLAFLDERKEL
ncbi:MAG: T9SS type A sorting domain-containing protein [Ignavibacteriales bacterium]|nr:T9SS type A sorting domain-containing protein [Ignavibacteriales bacterium]